MTCDGFVYLWYDTTRKMFYIGSHLGNQDDGYVCSSKAMLLEYRKRPNNFKRRILKRCSKAELKGWEQFYLDKIQSNELYYKNRKYYNIKRFAAGGDITADMPTRSEIIKRRYGKKHSDAVKKAIAARTPEREKIHQDRRKASLRKTFSQSDYTNYQDVPFDVFINGAFYRRYRNKRQFAIENLCDLSQINIHVKTGQWIVKQKRRHPFSVGDTITFVR